MQFEEVLKQIQVDTRWQEHFRHWVPRFIKEATTKNDWSEWDQEVFYEYFERAEGTTVFPIRQDGDVTKEDKEIIKSAWNRIAPLLKEIADSQNEKKPEANQNLLRLIRDELPIQQSPYYNSETLSDEILAKYPLKYGQRRVYELPEGSEFRFSEESTGKVWTIVERSARKIVIKTPNEKSGQDVASTPQRFRNCTVVSLPGTSHKGLESFTCRMVAGLQPNLLTPIVSRDHLAALVKLLKDQCGVSIPDFTGNDWYNDSNAVLRVFKNAMPDVDPYEIVIYPWQALEILRKNKDTPTQNNLAVPDMQKNAPLNTILYGPPGTGKTFNSINYALSIIEGRDLKSYEREDRGEVKKRFDQLLLSEQNPNGQIAFVTFHQSLAYEEFIEGIKPDLNQNEPDLTEKESEGSIRYVLSDGIFKKLAIQAASEFVGAFNTPAGNVLAYNEAYDQLVEEAVSAIERNKPLEITGRDRALFIIEEVTRGNNLRVKHQGGTRLYDVTRTRLAPIANAFPDLDAVQNMHREFRAIVGGMNSSAYYAVLNAIRTRSELRQQTAEPVVQAYNYDEQKAAVSVLSADDFRQPAKKNYVLIIDEINRGNISQIFGELITLIEDGKRAGQREALSVTLPYSRETFSVPPNLYILGTMNTADRSVEALDTALRRRFSFVEMPPIEKHGGIKEKVSINSTDFNFQEILTNINQRLEKLVGRDHKIGHSYFIHQPDWTWNNYLHAFTDKIIPLLQEYFYGDWAKICLVLGTGFVTLKPTDRKGIFAALPPGGDIAIKDSLEDLAGREVWELVSFSNEKSEQQFARALNLLLNKPVANITATESPELV